MMHMMMQDRAFLVKWLLTKGSSLIIPFEKHRRAMFFKFEVLEVPKSSNNFVEKRRLKKEEEREEERKKERRARERESGRAERERERERRRRRERGQVRDKRESDERRKPKNKREHEHGTHATMGKRKRVSKALEETERNMYKTFSGAANAVSLLYTQVGGFFFFFFFFFFESKS